MHIVIVFGWWLLPAAITLLGAALAWRFSPKVQQSGIFPDVFSPLVSTVYWLLVLACSLLAWFLWLL